MGNVRVYSLRCLAVATALILSIVSGKPAEPAGVRETVVNFRFEVRPVLAKHCFSCHGPDEGHREADLRLDLRDSAIESGAIVPGDIDESELIARISSTDPDYRMPPVETGRQLSEEEIERIEAWIAAGAPYSRHWAYEPPRRPELPPVEKADWPRNPVDHLILARLEVAQLQPEPRADPYKLLRRVSLDLVGLPPTSEEADAFVSDHSPDAYERAVDRLLASPAYGEHWARKWLDLARYADTDGYQIDNRRSVWAYRDWVIEALNADMPYDQFTIKQLAGDLLPDPSDKQLIATTFHRNTMTNEEGGTDDEEFRVAAVIDRVNTTMQVWMATTIGCCQCHTHKFDPFSHQDYYELMAFFNQSADADRPDHFPTLPTPTAELTEPLAAIRGQIKQRRRQIESFSTEQLDAELRDWEASLRQSVQWQTLHPSEVVSEGGADCNVDQNGTVLVSGKNPASERYLITAAAPLDAITAVRVEALPHPSLPGKGPGRDEQGNFVMSQFSIAQADSKAAAHGVRYLRVELPGPKRILSLAEVQIYSNGVNIGPTGVASQSSTAYGGNAELAIDGNTNGDFDLAQSTTHTVEETIPWWEVDLGGSASVQRVILWNRSFLEERLHGAVVSLLDADRQLVWSTTLTSAPNTSFSIHTDGPASLPWSAAWADFSELNRPVEHALDGADLTQAGWGIAPQTGQTHQAVFELQEPLQNQRGRPLRLAIDHRFQAPGSSRLNLGYFRLSVTEAPLVLQRMALPPDVVATMALEWEERTPGQLTELRTFYRGVAPRFEPLRKQIVELEQQLAELGVPQTPIMRELPVSQRRQTHVFIRGNFLDHGPEVFPATPDQFAPLPEGAPRNRLGLARWLVDRENPLTARVAANRMWEHLFGCGLVETSEDFGSQGALPSHPRLLDWLAVELMDNGWSLKALAKTIVMSATYRQSSRVVPEKLRRDPGNRLLSRGPRFRLSAEQIHDQALAVSGLLSRKMYGPSVMPPQPEGVWNVVFSTDKWVTSTGEDRYRRGLYTFWRRTSPYPSAMAFDATSRETCTLRRVRTNTPVAALVTLNDSVYVEAAQALARLAAQDSHKTAQQRVERLFRRVLIRPPKPAEVGRLLQLYESQRQHYQAHTEEAGKLAGLASDTAGDNTDQQLVELAAWTIVSNVLLNLDEVLTKD